MNMVLNGLTDLKKLLTVKKNDMAPSSKSVRTPAFHAGNPGSNPGGVTIILNKEDLPMIVSMKSCSEDNPPEGMGS